MLLYRPTSKTENNRIRNYELVNHWWNYSQLQPWRLLQPQVLKHPDRFGLERLHYHVLIHTGEQHSCAFRHAYSLHLAPDRLWQSLKSETNDCLSLRPSRKQHREKKMVLRQMSVLTEVTWLNGNTGTTSTISSKSLQFEDLEEHPVNLIWRLFFSRQQCPRVSSWHGALLYQ